MWAFLFLLFFILIFLNLFLIFYYFLGVFGLTCLFYFLFLVDSSGILQIFNSSQKNRDSRSIHGLLPSEFVSTTSLRPEQTLRRRCCSSSSFSPVLLCKRPPSWIVRFLPWWSLDRGSVLQRPTPPSKIARPRAQTASITTGPYKWTFPL